MLSYSHIHLVFMLNLGSLQEDRPPGCHDAVPRALGRCALPHCDVHGLLSMVPCLEKGAWAPGLVPQCCGLANHPYALFPPASLSANWVESTIRTLRGCC